MRSFPFLNSRVKPLDSTNVTPEGPVARCHESRRDDAQALGARVSGFRVNRRVSEKRIEGSSDLAESNSGYTYHIAPWRTLRGRTKASFMIMNERLGRRYRSK
jgi:hypothetical protein